MTVADADRPRRQWRTMRVRTTAGAAVVVGLALLIGAAVLVGVLRRSLEDNVKTSVQLRAKDVAGLLDSGASPEDLAVEAKPDDDISLVQVLDGTGAVVVSSSNVAGQPAVADLHDGGTTRVRGISVSPEDRYRVVAASTAPGRGPALTVLAARSLEPLEETITRVTRALGVGLPILLLLVALTTWTVVGRALRPVEAIGAEVRSITESGLDRRVPEPRTDDEIGRLARTMNEMLVRLQGARDRQREFVSDASHELRSPIASIRHQLEVALAHPEATDLPTLARDLLDEDLRMQQVVEDLLLLARTDEGAAPVVREQVDLDDLALDGARRVRTQCSVRVDTSGVRAARVSGDLDQLARAVRNLVDNAVRHASSQIQIGVRVDGETAVLTVDDDGPGVPSDDRARVFERFTRLDHARARPSGGSGLGLAIVARVAEAHGGTARCADAPGGGARFELRLPAALSD